MGTGSGRRGIMLDEDGERKVADLIGKGDDGPARHDFGVGEIAEGELPIDIEELNDWSTSIGKSTSVIVGDAGGEPK